MHWIIPIVISIITGVCISLFALRYADPIIWICRLQVAADTRRLSAWGASLYRQAPTGGYRRHAMLLLIGYGVVPVGAWIMTGRILLAMATLVAIWFGQQLIYQYQRAQVIDRIEEDLPNVVNSMVASVRAGRSLPQAFADVIDRASSALSQEFTLIVDEHSRGGLSLEESLFRAHQRIGLENFTMVSKAIIIGLSQGGDILSILQRNAESLRELLKLRKKLYTETANVRMQEKMIMVMTPLFCGLVCSFDDEIPYLLFDTFLGNLLLAIVFTIQAVSILWIRRIVRATL